MGKEVAGCPVPATPLQTGGEELGCVVLPQRRNSSTAGLIWVAAFENKGKPAQLSIRIQHEITREVLFQNFIKNKTHVDICTGN